MFRLASCASIHLVCPLHFKVRLHLIAGVEHPLEIPRQKELRPLHTCEVVLLPAGPSVKFKLLKKFLDRKPCPQPYAMLYPKKYEA